MLSAKLIVVGPGEAGKSTLIERLADRAVNLSVRGRTVAMDHGVLRRDDAAVTLIGVPGQERFGPVREVLVRGARGAIWVHPSGEEADASTVELLTAAAPARLPYLVFINHRPDDPIQESFPVPAGLEDPLRILWGSLLSPSDGFRDLVDAVWELAGAGLDLAQEEGTT